MLDACCNATSSFALPHVGWASRSTPPLRAYLRRNPQRSGSLGEVGSVWLETVERSAILVSGCVWTLVTHDDDRIGSCNNEEAFLPPSHINAEDLGKTCRGIWIYIDICSTLSTAAATILAEPSTSDDRFPGVLLRHKTDHLRSWSP